MREQIIELKKLNSLNINWQIFSNMLLHIHDGVISKNTWISNNLTIEDWEKLLNTHYTEVGVNAEQIRGILQYLVKYHFKYFSFHHDKESYSVSKEFDNRNIENIFLTEKIILTTIEIVCEK